MVNSLLSNLNSVSSDLNLQPNCSLKNDIDCKNDMNCKFENNKCQDNTNLSELDLNMTNTEKLNKILLSRERMLEVNLHKNDIKNKRIYVLFVFIILIVLTMTIVHFKYGNK